MEYRVVINGLEQYPDTQEPRAAYGALTEALVFAKNYAKNNPRDEVEVVLLISKIHTVVEATVEDCL